MRKEFFIAFLLFINLAQAKTIVVGIKTNHLSAKDKAVLGLQGGDTIMLEAGDRGAIQFADIDGNADNYITIINAEGLCEIKEATLPYGISLRNCHYVRLSGNGSAKIPYGIKIAEVTRDGAGLGISDKSDNIEVCYLEISNTKGPGILCKTNPDCITDRDNYTSVNTSIHNNYVHHTGTEGMYIGSTAFEGSKIRCDSALVTRFPPLLKNVAVYENVVEYTGWDGIQISDAIDVECFGNKISYDSQKDEPWQNCGLIIGGGASGRFYQNVISFGKGYPINCFGTGEVEIRDNEIVMDITSTKTAIYVNDKLATQQTKYLIDGNTIDTKHLPAIVIINRKQRKPDLIKDNKVKGASTADAVSFEGTKPIIK